MSDNGNKKVKATFKFHPIGQGLFYSGQIGEFNFIYDCGASHLEKEYKDHQENVIFNYKEEFLSEKTPKVALFIISHFHYDHISGLVCGCFDDVEIDVFVIPYYSRLERLLMVMEINENDENLSHYFDFLDDPISFLKKKFSGCKIIVISSNDEEATNNGEEDAVNGRNIAPQLYENLAVDDSLEKSSEYSKNEDVLYRKSKGSIYIKEIWEFRFYNQRVSDDLLVKLQKDLEEQIISVDLKKGLKDKKYRDEIRSAYKDLELKPNETSLIMFHSPLLKEKLFMKVCSNKTSQAIIERNNKEDNKEDNNWLAHLLTGDINLNVEDSLINIDEHFKNKLCETAIFQIPHHGSDHNWNDKIYHFFNEIILSVNSSGNVPFYNHPGKEVKAYLEKNYSENENYILCNRNTSALIEYDLYNELILIKLELL